MGFEQVERQLAGHIRDPQMVAGPEGIEPRRLKIYRELFYKNLETFISNGFPVLRSLYSDEPWHAMVRDFMIKHQSHSPYFLEISQEFLAYLQLEREPKDVDPPFMKELAHYEWVELALDVADIDVAELDIDPEADLLTGKPLVSPLAWSLAYQYPVHQIGQQFQPEQASQEPHFLIVYRDRQDKVAFMEANSVTARLLELLQDEAISSGQQALSQLATEMQHPQPQQIIDFGSDLLRLLHSQDILLGAR
ncbi:MAG: hypothetical protein ACJAYG_000424 [Oceanicoccus sp.]|jgi:hypothetical protein